LVGRFGRPWPWWRQRAESPVRMGVYDAGAGTRPARRALSLETESRGPTATPTVALAPPTATLSDSCALWLTGGLSLTGGLLSGALRQLLPKSTIRPMAAKHDVEHRVPCRIENAVAEERNGTEHAGEVLHRQALRDPELPARLRLDAAEYRRPAQRHCRDDRDQDKPLHRYVHSLSPARRWCLPRR